MGIWTLKKKLPEVDEHDQPTEPVSRPGIPGSAFPPVPNPFGAYDTIPAPHATNHTIYPTLPPSVDNVPVLVEQPKGEPVYTGWRWKIMPALMALPLRLLPLEVGLCFVGLQLLLLARFVCKIWNLAPGYGWVDVVYGSSNVALLPIQLLLPPLHQALFTRVEPYTLLAIVLYGLCSRILVHILKMMVNAHIQIDRRPTQNLSTSKTAGGID
ncbi:hypothetical protein [Dictyobacter kobayashii]|uniref:hypothetical protein n=1 Tax=Dictyobacter kobayashii TaxID=2014872 RepID=UPI000F81BCB7|nr:hypothetical protein [Dictyobacter kobayashii]